MRILNVDNSLDPRGGGQSERTFQMSRALAAAGECVEVVVLNGGLSAQRLDRIAPARVVALDVLNHRYNVPRTSLSAVRRLVERADVIHLMGYWSVLNAMIFRAARKARKPYVLCPAGSWRFFGRSKTLKAMFEWTVGRRIVAAAASLIAITRRERELFESYGVSREKIAVIPNAIDPADFQQADDAGFRRRFRIGERPFILFLGRLAPIKGPDLLLEAYASASANREFDLVFAGADGGMEADLRRRAETQRVAERVHFIGHLDSAARSEGLHAAAFLVIPSRHEAMSMVVLEAGAAATPVLLTDRCGVDDVEQAGGGIVVACGIESLRGGLERMAAANRAPMAHRVRQWVLDRYTWKRIAVDYQRMFAEILGRQRQ